MVTRPAPPAPDPALERFHPVVREWFARAFARPTPAQAQGWPAIATGQHALILAPTGSGKTLAAFLWGLSALLEERLDGHTASRLLYISPLKALNYDVERNLRAPLAGMRAVAAERGIELPELSVAVRTGDTPQRERVRMLRHPPDVLITTPESLFLLLTSRGREILGGVTSVVVDEIHALAGGKRGTHLALSLERLERLGTEEGGGIQRIGLSATQRPLDEIARFLGGQDAEGRPRPVTVVDAGQVKALDLEVVVPVEDMREPGQAASPGDDLPARSIWPAAHQRLLELVRAHRSTLIFVNSRRLAERLAVRLNELAGEEIARAHHGSLAREQRRLIEDELKSGRLAALCATSSLELGIDMGAIDLVIQVESPRSVARGLQRVGRAGHHLDAVSRGRLFPTFRGDLLECATVVSRMQAGAIEETRVPRQPLDVLAQQLVAMVADAAWGVDELLAVARGAYPYAELSREQLEGVLDMLAGRYPSDEFAELRPRVVWDRPAGVVRGRDGARSLAVQNAGTIPDRGLYGVFLADGSGRVGELDEEMVYEARTGQTFMLGASTWRIEDITRDRVIVSPAPGAPGAVPFWRGEGAGRPFELGVEVGRLARELAGASEGAALARLAADSRLDDNAARNLVAYLRDQEDATGMVPSDRTIVVERFRDEIGDWRLCVLSPFGARVHAPWAMALSARMRSETGGEAHALWGDDGIALHVPDSDEAPRAGLALIDPDDLEELVLAELGTTALFGARFRENAARALLIPRRRPGGRTPLWQQRLRAASLLEVARRHGSFPVILETYRECLNDWFELPALRDLLGRIQRREVAVVEVETPVASPFAGSLMFEYVASYMYEDDTPAAERRAQALTLNRDLLRELLGHDELRQLLDAEALAEVEADLAGRSERARAASADAVHDLLRRVGDLTATEVQARTAGRVDAGHLLAALRREGRAAVMRVGGEERWIAAEDAGRYRDGAGAMPPSGLPEAFLEPVDDALASLLARYARSHGPFLAEEAAARLGLDAARAVATLATLERRGSLVRGELRPGGAGLEWCDADVLRRVRRASLARLRNEIEPAEGPALGRFLLGWHRIDRPAAAPGVDALREVVARLQGLALPTALWEDEVFPRRLGTYRPAWLDELVASGELVWVGSGAAARGGGRVALYFRQDAALLGPPPSAPAPEGTVVEALRAALASGAAFWDDLLEGAGAGREEVFGALWELVWAGEVTNDLWLPLRAPRRLPQLRGPSRSGPRAVRHSRGRGRGGASPVAGRWSLAERLFAGPPDGRERQRALAELLLERHGVVSRAAVLADGVPGGFASIYPELADLETLGVCRRGYFVEGLGGAQFALPGAVDRLRELGRAEDDEAVVLSAADPAQPYGAALPWPRRPGGRAPARTAGARVVLLGGEAVLYLERGGRRLLTLRRPQGAWLRPALAALAAWITADRRRRVRIERVDDAPVQESPLREALAEAGFQEDLRGMALRG